MLRVHFLDEGRGELVRPGFGSHDAKLSREQNDQWGDWSDLSNLDVDPSSHEKERKAIFTDAWTFGVKDDLHYQSLYQDIDFVLR